MTSRTPLGVQPRPPPQRTLSGSGIGQRPSHQRTLSQQYLPPSPIRKEAFLDFPSEPNDVAQGRYGASRRGGSRLKLELSNDSLPVLGLAESPTALETSKAFTPSRVMSMNNDSDLGDLSPHPSTRGQTAADEDTPPLPMPKRRPRFALPAKRQQLPTPPVSAPAKKDLQKDNRPRPYVVEVPSAAPRFSLPAKGDKKGYADFYPWTGNHTEDRFSEYVIKHGLLDKQNTCGPPETSSAKQSLFPGLRHKGGLTTLSQIFTGVLTQRRHSGQINAPSTFKPPPRATLTQSKSEGWLKELANPAIPLRKLSRTVPHGIRGKGLLDQCLNKNVPLDRAVWLSKCVGANDIRQLKRKGVNGTFSIGGEAKLIRDWTMSVEQFVESVVFASDDAEWKARVHYAIRLATHLYAEKLLDPDHYMDWLVSNLENSTHAKLPMWILILQIYWKDLLSLRKFGRRLVTALLSHQLTVESNPDRDILFPLVSKLNAMLTQLILGHPESFISPTAWPKYRETLHPSLSTDDEPLQRAYESVNHRNEKLCATTARSQVSIRHTLVKLLDSTLLTPFSAELSKRCWKLSDDKTALISSVLEWGICLHRPCVAKVYVATRLVRQWSAEGLDVTTSLLDFIESQDLEEVDQKKLLYHIVAELARSQHFSVARYLQWLIARGGPTEPEDVAPEGPCPTRLLVEIPTHTLNESLRSLRSNLLRRAEYQVDDETYDISMAMKCVKHALGMPLEPGDEMLHRKPMTIAKLEKRIGLSSRVLKCEVGAWLRSSLVEQQMAADNGTKNGFEISPRIFNAVRALMESAQDYAMLADVLKYVARGSNVDILASCADTVNLNLTVFAAIGAAKSLFDTFYDRLKVIIEEQGIGARPLLAALAILAPRIPGLQEVGAMLSKELTRSDRSTAVDACSPVSDNMAFRLQDSQGELHEEIEKLITTGTSVDKPTMGRLFRAIIGRLQICWDQPSEKLRAYGSLLARLRIFDAQHFDHLMASWINQVRSATNGPPILQVYPLLVTSGSLSVATILKSVSGESSLEPGGATAAGKSEGVSPIARPSGPSNSAGSKRVHYRPIYMQEVLWLTVMPPSLSSILTHEERYRYCVQQKLAVQEHSNDVLTLIRNAICEFCASQGEQQRSDLPLSSEECQDKLLSILRGLSLVNSQSVARTLAIKNGDPKIAALVDKISTKLLAPSASEAMQVSFDKILGLANELTLPFCQIKLSLSLALGETNNSESAERPQSHLELFAKAMDGAMASKNVSWIGMLPCLSPEITQHLRSRAQARFLDLFPCAKADASGSIEPEQGIQMAESALSVIEAIIRGSAAMKGLQLAPTAVDKLHDLWEILASEDSSLKSAVLGHWLPLLLNFMVLFTFNFDTSKASNEVRAKALIALSGILLEVDGLPKDVPSSLSGQIFDLALLLVDNLSEEARLQCVRVLQDATSDARIRYLFSFAVSPSENLMLSHKEKISPSDRRGLQLAGVAPPEKLSAFTFKKWEIIKDPTTIVGDNDTCLSLRLFDAIKI